MYFVVLVSSDCAALGYEVLVETAKSVKPGGYLLATNPDLDDACHQADQLHHALKLYQWEMAERSGEMHALAVSGLTKDMAEMFKKVLDGAL